MSMPQDSPGTVAPGAVKPGGERVAQVPLPGPFGRAMGTGTEPVRHGFRCMKRGVRAPFPPQKRAQETDRFLQPFTRRFAHSSFQDFTFPL